jgi:hypothetical protein
MAKNKYQERVLPNFGAFLAVSLLLPAISLVFEPFSLVVGISVGVVAVLASWSALYAFSPVISISETELRAGKAKIPLKLLGKSKVINKGELFTETGPGLSPLAYRVFQGTVKTAIKIDIKDPKDKTPYWLVSTRHPERLKKALDS